MVQTGVTLPFLAASSSSMAPSSSRAPPVLDLRFAKLIGEQTGNVDLPPSVCHAVIEEVGHHLRAVIRQASRFAIHGRRSRIMPDDVTEALKHLSAQLPLETRHFYEQPLRMITLSNDERFWAREDTEVDLNALINEPPPKYPAALTIRTSYLVYDGVYQLKKPEFEKKSEEEEEDDNCAMEAEEAGRLERSAKRRRKQPGVGLHCRHSLRELPTKERVFIRPQSTETLSVEQQTFFKEVVETCMGTDDKRRTEALRSLETDPGVQALVGLFARLISDSIHINLVQKSLSMLIYMVRVARAISNNKAVRLDGVLHDLIPALISCMVGKVLCLRPESDNHWALRDFSSKTLVSVMRQHGSEDVSKRALSVIRRVFERRNNTYAVLYGCAQALYDLSSDSERVEIYAYWVDLMKATRPDAMYQATQLEKFEAARLHHLLSKLEPLLRKTVERVNRTSS